MTAFLIVRAEVDSAVRDAFDAWYQDEHLPDAVEFLRRGGRVAGLERRGCQRAYRLLRVRGSGGGEEGDGVRRAQADDRRIRPALARQGDPDP